MRKKTYAKKYTYAKNLCEKYEHALGRLEGGRGGMW